MFDLYEEFQNFTAALDQRQIDYALCGGLAMAVHGFPRATIDIDVVILAETLGLVLEEAKKLGYTIRGKDLTFANGVIEIRRVSKIDSESGDLLTLDFLLVTPEIQTIWNDRVSADWQGGKLSVVSREGLIGLKRLRNSGQDQVDISVLESSSDND